MFCILEQNRNKVKRKYVILGDGDMKKICLAVVICMMFVMNAYADSLFADPIKYSSTAIFINASDTGIQTIGLNRNMIDNLINEDYKNERKILKDTLNQDLLEHLYFAPIDDVMYISIFYSSLNCGTEGCLARIYLKDRDKLIYVKDSKYTYDCIGLAGHENIYMCSSLQ